MAKLTIDIPDELMSTLTPQAIQQIVIDTLRIHLKTDTKTMTKTRTWELCGTLEVNEPEPKYIVGRDEQGNVY